MKVILKKSVKNRFWHADDYDILDLNPINKALTKYYLPYLPPSPLKSFLLEKLHTFRQMYLYLEVACEENSSVVKSISLECSLLDDVERMYEYDKVDWYRIRECLTEYFLSIGYPGMRCANDEDIINFIQRLGKDIPLTEEYFEIIDERNEYER